MDLHDYIIISQNKQDNSRLCTILDYHLACSDHDERVGKHRAASFFILYGVWRLSIILHIKLHIVDTYRILTTQTINIFYHTYILLYYQNLKCTITIILLLVKINKKF